MIGRSLSVALFCCYLSSGLASDQLAGLDRQDGGCHAAEGKHSETDGDELSSEQTRDERVVGEKAVLSAISRGDLVELKRLEASVKVAGISNLGLAAWNSPNADLILHLREQGWILASDLQIAAVRGDHAAVTKILKHLQEVEYPPDSDIPYKTGPDFGFLAFTSDTPLRLAIRRGHTEVVRALIDGGANVNERLVDARRHRALNEYPLSEAVVLGRTEIVQLLVDGKALLEDPPLQYSQKGPRANRADTLSEFYAQHANSPRSVVEKKLKELLEAGLIVQEADPDANVICPLVLAIRAGRAKIVSILLTAGANPNVLLGGQRRPLHEAVMKGHPEIVRMLIEKGADVNAVAVDNKLTPLTLAVGYQNGDIVDLLTAAGAK